ncbi:hypothetical protein ACHAWX_005705, partial [Stephanocyclus meneghinianus]
IEEKLKHSSNASLAVAVCVKNVAQKLIQAPLSSLDQGEAQTFIKRIPSSGSLRRKRRLDQGEGQTFIKRIPSSGRLRQKRRPHVFCCHFVNIRAQKLIQAPLSSLDQGEAQTFIKHIPSSGRLRQKRRSDADSSTAEQL